MRSIKSLFICILFFAFGSVSAQQTDTLIGAFNRDAFYQEAFKTWYTTEYGQYEPEQTVMEEIIVNKDLDIMIFLGTWCSDSRREVPRFLKVLDELDYNTDRVKMIGLNRKKSAPGYEDNSWNIEYVPTFIFLKNGTEIGRIIETPQFTLEKDMRNILSQK